MNHTPIYITREDNSKLRLLIATALHSNVTASLQNLRRELDRAIVSDYATFPSGVVTLESTVEFQDLETREIETFSIVFPERANVDAQRISILAPIGTALIGCREGDIVRWSTPGGVRQLKILNVTPAPSEVSTMHEAFSLAR
jgi:regulator of nucleoside diphosphate kinase